MNSGFKKEVFEAVANIPDGKVATYAGLLIEGVRFISTKA